MAEKLPKKDDFLGCPFCGKPPVVYDHYFAYSAQCDTCGFAIMRIKLSTVRKIWNKRVPLTKKPKGKKQ